MLCTDAAEREPLRAGAVDDRYCPRAGARSSRHECDGDPAAGSRPERDAAVRTHLEIVATQADVGDGEGAIARVEEHHGLRHRWIADPVAAEIEIAAAEHRPRRRAGPAERDGLAATRAVVIEGQRRRADAVGVRREVDD